MTDEYLDPIEREVEALRVDLLRVGGRIDGWRAVVAAHLDDAIGKLRPQSDAVSAALTALAEYDRGERLDLSPGEVDLLALAANAGMFAMSLRRFDEMAADNVNHVARLEAIRRGEALDDDTEGTPES